MKPHSSRETSGLKSARSSMTFVMESRSKLLGASVKLCQYSSALRDDRNVKAPANMRLGSSAETRPPLTPDRLPPPAMSAPRSVVVERLPGDGGVGGLGGSGSIIPRLINHE